eukprot:5182203-Lingulodinium_polyedra.AAC.1
MPAAATPSFIALRSWPRRAVGAAVCLAAFEAGRHQKRRSTVSSACPQCGQPPSPRFQRRA